MKCFVHSSVDTVGLCSQCGKGGCSECLRDLGDSLICVKCVSRSEITYQSDQDKIRKGAKRKIVISLMFAALGLWFGVSMAPRGNTVGTALLSTYAFWCLYLSIPLVWKAWWRLLRRLMPVTSAGPTSWLTILLLFYIPLIGGYIYGMFGGGVYQFIKNYRVAYKPLIDAGMQDIVEDRAMKKAAGKIE